MFAGGRAGAGAQTYRSGSRMNRGMPSFFRVVSTDYFSSVVLIIPMVLWGMYYFLPGPAGRAHDPILAYIALGLTFSSGLILLWRWCSIVAVFRDGIQVDGMVTQVNFHRDRGRVTYTYTYQGGKHESGSAILKNKHTRLLYPGQEVTVIVSRDNPKRTLLQDLYL